MLTDSLYPWKSTVANLAIVFTIGLFSAGILTCRKILQDRSVGVIPYLPFIAACLNCSFWDTYGILKNDGSLIFINSLGLVLQLIYLVVYSYHTDNKVPLCRDFTIASAIVGVVVLYVTVLSDYNTKMNHLGVIANFFTICFFASPLSTMALVIKTKSTESMSLPFSLMSTMATSLWTLYGIIISDFYVQFPNLIGFVLSLIQVSLFCIYSSKKKILTIESSA